MNVVPDLVTTPEAVGEEPPWEVVVTGTAVVVTRVVVVTGAAVVVAVPGTH